MTRADRYACLKCPYYHETGREPQGKMKSAFSHYCTKAGRIRKIAGKADWTGLVPKWCPELEENR